MSLQSFIFRFALGGVVGPFLLSAVWWWFNTISSHGQAIEVALRKFTLIIWPSSLALLVGAGFSNTSLSSKLFLFSMILNVILYSVVGVFIWYGLRRHHVLLLPPVLGIVALWVWLLNLE